MTLAPLAPYRLRTPLLSLHVQTQRLNPTAGKRPPYSMHKTPLQLVRAD